VSLLVDRPSFPPVSVVLGVQWPAHEWYGGWDGDRSVHLWMLVERLPAAGTPAPEYGPQLNLGNESASPVSASNVVLPFLEAGSTRGPVSAASASPAAELAGRSALLAALAGTEAAIEKLSADARRPGAAAVKDLGRALASAPARLAPGPGAALVDPVNSAAPGGAAKEGNTGEAALPPGGAAPAGAPGKVVLPAGGDSAAPAAQTLEAAPAQAAGGLDLVNLPSRAAALLEGGLPFDLPALTQGVDAFFARLGSPGEARDRFPAYARVLPWLAVLSAAAFELTRRRQQQPAAAGDEVLVGPAAFLPHPDEDR
jgi:hypothetical protein